MAFSPSMALDTAPSTDIASSSEDPGTPAHSLLYSVHLLDPRWALEGARGGRLPLPDGGDIGLVEEDEDRDNNDPDAMSSQEAGPCVPSPSLKTEQKPPLGDRSPAS